MNNKKFHRVIIVDEYNAWVATSSNCTLNEAITLYKSETHKGELTYNESTDYSAWGIGSDEDRIDF